MVYRAAAATCPGKKKSYNSNNFYLNSKYITEEFCSSQVLLTQKKDQKGLQMYAVSEGYGADTYADEASLIAMKNLFKYHNKKLEELAAMKEAGASTANIDMVDFVSAYIKSTNNAICNRAEMQEDDAMHDPLRATLALICVKGKRVVTANLGNTRIYHYRSGVLQQISEDHTQAQKMVQLGLLSPERAAAHPKRHKLTQFLGMHSEDEPFAPALFELTAQVGDVFLICSRAFYEGITQEDMQAIIGSCSSVGDIVNKMMKEVADGGFGEDTTLIALQALDAAAGGAAVGASAAADGAVGGAAGVGAAAGAGVAVGAGAAENARAATGARTPREYTDDTATQAVPPRAVRRAVETDTGTQIAQKRPASRTALFVHDEEEPVRRAGESRTADENERTTRSEREGAAGGGLMGKLRAFLGIDGVSSETQIWPAVVVFALCLIIIILFIVLGVKYYRGARDTAPSVPPLLSTATPAGTPDGSGSPEASTPPAGSDNPGGVATDNPAQSTPPAVTNTPDTPTPPVETETPPVETETPPVETETPPAESESPTPPAEGTEEPSEEPTEEPSEEPTEEPSEEPTEEPSEEPTEKPSETPGGESTEAPSEEPGTAEPSAEETPAG